MRAQYGSCVKWGSLQLPTEKQLAETSGIMEEAFSRDEGGVSCQGAAHYLYLKYREAGYKSYIIGFGNKYYTHAMTLVQISHGGMSKYAIQDPTFNISYVDRAGNPLSVFAIVELLRERRAEEIAISGPGLMQTEYLAQRGVTRDMDLSMYRTTYLGRSGKNPDVDKYRIDLELRDLEKLFVDERTLPPGFKSMPNYFLYLQFATVLYVYNKGCKFMSEADKRECRDFFYAIKERAGMVFPAIAWQPAQSA